MKETCLVKYNNNFGVENGAKLLNKHIKECLNGGSIVNRNFHQGFKSIMNDNTKDTIYTDGILTSAEGLSVRWLYFK